MAFGLSLVAAVSVVLAAFVQFAERFYDLTTKEAGEFVYRLVFGLPEQPPKYPVLSVKAGRADPDGPSQLLKIGGPGFLSVDHDSAVVTARTGEFKRVLGPGFHTLEPFEGVWDVIDLRPQHRKIKVEFMTRDGLPAYCEASIAFRIDNGGEEITDTNPYPFSEDAVYQAAHVKRVRSREGNNRLQDWTQRVAFGALDGEVRNCLERYYLNDLLDPQHPAQDIKQLEREILAKVRQSAEGIGVRVDRVQLSPVLPSEDAVSQEWLRVWQAGLQRDIEDSTTEGKALYTQQVEQARVKATANLIRDMMNQIDRIRDSEDAPVAPDLIVLSFLNVLRSMSENDPDVQKLMSERAKDFRGILQALQDVNKLSAEAREVPVLEAGKSE
jgi:hypothetical protein